MSKNPYIKSCISYSGGKYKLLPQILPLFPQRKFRVFVEPFCLSGDTHLYTKNGIVTLKDLNVGDYILDDSGHFVEVIRKIKSPKQTGIKIKTKGNVEIVATDNHIFYVDGQEIQAKDLRIGMTLNTSYVPQINYEKYIDMSNYITYSQSRRYGRSGKIIDDTYIKLYHCAPTTLRHIKVTPELMRMYGLIVAEGDKSNITMHKSEQHILEEFIKNYSQLLGLDLTKHKKYYMKSNSNAIQLAVPYKTIYSKIFFEALGIGSGARNKNINFFIYPTQ